MARTPSAEFDRAIKDALISGLGISEQQATTMFEEQRFIRAQTPAATRVKIAALKEYLALQMNELRHMAMTEPLVICLAPATVQHNAEHNAALLNFGPEAFRQRLVKRAPKLLTTTPTHLAGQIEGLHGVLPFTSDIPRIIASDPYLATYSPHQLASNMIALAELLETTVEDLQRRWRSKPRPATTNPDRAAQLIEALVTRLTLQRATVIKLVLRMPALLTQSPETMIANLRALAKGLALPERLLVAMTTRCPHLLARDPIATLRKLEEMAAAVGWSWLEATSIARRYPGVLTKAVDSTVARVVELADLLGVDRSEIVALTFRQPQLLAMAPAGTARKAGLIGAIRTALGSPMTMSAILTAHYSALLYSAERLALRLTLAEHGLGPRHASGLLALSNASAEALLS